MNLKIMIRVLGLLLVVEGFSMLIALAVALVYNDGDVQAFMQSALI